MRIVRAAQWLVVARENGLLIDLSTTHYGTGQSDPQTATFRQSRPTFPLPHGSII
jgi:hypothetical protein